MYPEIESSLYNYGFSSSHSCHQHGMTGPHPPKPQVMTKIKSAETLVITPSLLSCLARPQKRNYILSCRLIGTTLKRGF